MRCCAGRSLGEFSGRPVPGARLERPWRAERQRRHIDNAVAIKSMQIGAYKCKSFDTVAMRHANVAISRLSRRQELLAHDGVRRLGRCAVPDRQFWPRWRCGRAGGRQDRRYSRRSSRRTPSPGDGECQAWSRDSSITCLRAKGTELEWRPGPRAWSGDGRSRPSPCGDGLLPGSSLLGR
jgi:hypothetical protein